MREALKVMLLTATANLLAVLQAMGYGLLVRDLPGGLIPPGNLVFVWSALTLLASYAIFGPILMIANRSLSRVFDQLLRGGTPDPAQLEQARRRALELPVYMSRLSTIVWVLSAASFPLYVWAVGAQVELLAKIHVMIVTILIGGVSGTFIYYIIEWRARARIIPVLFPDGRLSRVTGVRPVTLGFKICVLLVVTVLMPIVVLTFAALMGTLTPQVVLYLGASFFLFGILQAAFIGHSISKPVTDLAREVDKVTREDLSAQAQVLSLDHIGQLAEGFNEMVVGLRRAVFVKETFGRYVTRQVLDEILKGKVELGGELRCATVMFSDIRGFTALSEKLGPAELVSFLNRYLDIMVDVVVEYGGTVDKFIGDAVMASFGVPLSKDDDALRAVKAALQMTARLVTWNAQRASAGELPIDIGIGLHTGDVVAGNIGSAKKMEYTVIGDTVNTSSRIEQLNKRFNTRLLISSTTFALVKDQVIARALDPVEVKGKALPLTVYEVTGLR